jgi:hypothetical protein
VCESACCKAQYQILEVRFNFYSWFLCEGMLEMKLCRNTGTLWTESMVREIKPRQT